ncbi:TonB-dependent receptor [Mucilaginibacter yixingensis]|nr:TonB-dependent receptor [Mucilaginibacter yixingensis]
MKLIIAFLIVTVVQASAISKAQNVTIKAAPGSLEEVFNAIHQQTGYNFIYNSAMIKKSAPVNIDVNAKPLKETLDQVFADQPLGYVIEDQTIVVTKRAATAGPVTGTVTDATGATLPGVTVKVKGTNIVTSTDVSGKFHVNLPVGNEVLVFSFIGYKTQEIPASGQKNFSIKLEEGTSSLDEVVVIGYGVMKKRDLTGAIGTVKGADIAQNPVSNPIEALQGRVSGVDVERSSGQAGASPNITIRGTRTLNGGADPLYIVDGIQGASAANINPNDIENIEVLKDASSTAIYGSQAANGVIIITTKKAKAGSTQIDVNSYYGINGFASYPKPLMGDAWLQYQQDKYYAAHGSYATDIVAQLGLTPAAVDAINNKQYVDWVGETLKQGSQQNHHIAIRGGSEKVRGDFALGLIDEKGVYKGDEVKTYNSRSGAEVQFNKFILGGIRNSVTWKDGNTTNSRINKAYGILPLGTPYDADGNVNLTPLPGDPNTISPIANYQPGVYVSNSKNLNLSVNPYLIITPIKNLSIRSNLSVNYTWNRNGLFENERSYNVASLGSGGQKDASYATKMDYSYLWENIINYNFTINKDHNFGLTGITSYGDNRSETESIAGQGLDYDGFLFYDMGAVNLVTSKSTGYVQSNLASVAGRFNYNYKGKYLLEASWRIDGASQLVHKWSQFPSVSAGWNITEEKFMDQTKTWLSNLKLRAGWGSVGNSGGISPYSSQTQVTDSRNTTPLTLGGASQLPIYILTKAVSNPNLKWERSDNTNIGFDASFLRDRIQFSAEAYYTNTTGLLYNRNLPSTSGGFDAKTPYVITQNIGTSVNRGIELTASGLVLQKKGFTWNTSLTYTRADEKLTSLDLGNSVNAAGYIALNLFVGSPIKTVYGYKKVGIWQTSEATEAALYGAKPGDIKLATVPQVVNGVSDNGVHTYSANDRQIIGHQNPNWMGGWQNTFTYKGIDLTVYLTARFGQTLANASVLGYYNAVAQPVTYDYWTPNNPTNAFPQPTSGSTNNDYKTYGTSLTTVDGSYWKIKNLTLGYTLPVKWSQKVSIKNLRIYGTAYNPFIYTRNKMLKGVDPENGGADSFPLYKQIVFGINVSF